MRTDNNKSPVSEGEYDRDWINDTWGWDTPSVFIENQGRDLRPRIMRAIKLANLEDGMHVLDIGCGRGEVVLYCGRNNISAVGIDFSEDAIAIAEKAKATYLPKQQLLMQFICGNLHALDTHQKFDRILLLDIVEHLNDGELHSLFTVCKNLLAENGAMIIHTLPNRWVYDITYTKIIRFLMPWLPADPRSEKEKKNTHQ